MKDKKKRGIGLRFALAGLKTALLTERNFRIHLMAMLLVLLLALFFDLSAIEWMVLFLTISMVLVTELLNSVIEVLIDYLRPEIHPEAKKIKDMSAAAVLITAIIAVIIGCIIFIPKLFA